MNMYPISVQILTYVENVMVFVVFVINLFRFNFDFFLFLNFVMFVCFNFVLVQIRDDEKCCVCKLFTPKEVRESPCLIFTKWLQCDQCKHSSFGLLNWKTWVNNLHTQHFSSSLIRFSSSESDSEVLLVFVSGLTDGQSCQAIDSFLRGVYIIKSLT
jgi:hypothetical protein